MRASTSHTGPDWSNIFLVTIANAERLVRSVLCVIDSSQQTNETGSCVLFVKGIFAWIIAAWIVAGDITVQKDYLTGCPRFCHKVVDLPHMASMSQLGSLGVASWCERRLVDPVSIPVALIVEFLVAKEKKGLAFRTLVVYCSA